LVKEKRYQDTEIDETSNLLKAINRRKAEEKNPKQKSLDYKIVQEYEAIYNLKFLIKDYLSHIKHHVKQVIDETIANNVIN